ncbi:MAG: DUF2829 domain-containing protein [Xanthobacteraceae bacterium]|nr:DUF2829 domain-containing protein [Xanthobacteraceae bacterium]
MSDESARGIGWALKQLHNNSRVRRAGWNGMWLYLVTKWSFSASPPPAGWDAVGMLPFVLMRTADAQVVPWLCSQTDLLAIDWELAE